MHVNNIQSNQNTVFGAKLVLKGDIPDFAKANLPYLENLASRVGLDTDSICLKFGKQIVNKKNIVLHEQGERSQDFTACYGCYPIEIIKNINNEISEEHVTLTYPEIDDEYEQLVQILKDLNKVSMDDFWAKNQKAQDKYERRHHLGKFAK